MARPVSNLLSQRGITGVVDCDARWAPPAVRFGDYSCSFHVKPNVSMSLGSVRFMGIGSLKEGNRAGQHGVRYPQAKPDGSPEKAESDAREQFLEKAKAESGTVEPRQSIGETTTELKFGVKDGKNTEESIHNASEELFRQSDINAKSDKPTMNEDNREYSEHQNSNPEVLSEEGAREDPNGRNATSQSLLDGANKVELRGQENESVLGIGGKDAGGSSTDESTAAGERARENIDQTRSEMRGGKARSPQSGVIVGNVASAGANALENEGDIPQFSKEQEETGAETLDIACSLQDFMSVFGTQTC